MDCSIRTINFVYKLNSHMYNILRNIFVGALLISVWGFIFAATFKHVNAEEPETGTEIKLICGMSEEDYSAIVLRPEHEYGAHGLIKHVTRVGQEAKSGLLIQFPTEYILVVPTEVGYNSHYINRYNLRYEIMITINTVGKSLKTGGSCRIHAN